ncbi:MAG: AEC family transporter [Fimbriimonadales bacterium]|nr:AEC family transporter [Fimbriimonadales bacterium]GBC91311.1 hypothetical protein HRbin14_02077 [bacterium HR14]
MNGALAQYLTMFFALLGLGAVIRRVGWIADAHIHWLVPWIVRVPLSALVFSALAKSSVSPSLLGVWGVGLVSTLGALGLAWLLGHLLRLRPSTRAILMVGGTLGNTGFLGTPLIAALYEGDPQRIASAVTFDMGVTALVVHTLGLSLLAAAGAKGERTSLTEGLKRVASMPVFWATLLGYLTALLSIPIPQPVLFTLETLGQITVPLALIAIGAMIRWRALGNRWRALLLIVAYKCVATPLFTLGWLLLSGLPEGLARSVLLQSAMPTVMVSAVYAAYYQTDAELAASLVVVSVPVALALLPLWTSVPL